AEVFGSWRVGRFRRNIQPNFIPSNSEFGGVKNEFPYPPGHWAKHAMEPIVGGATVALLCQSRGNAMSLAPRVMLKFPSGGATAASTKAYSGTIDLVASGEFSGKMELSGMVGYVGRGSPDEFDLSSGFRWGVGAGFPSRSPLRVLLELEGESPTGDSVTVNNQI